MSSTTILDSAENILSLLREYTASVCLFFNNDPTCANNHWSQQKKGRRRGQKSSPVVTQGRASEPEHQPVTAQGERYRGPMLAGLALMLPEGRAVLGQEGNTVGPGPTQGGSWNEQQSYKVHTGAVRAPRHGSGLQRREGVHKGRPNTDLLRGQWEAYFSLLKKPRTKMEKRRARVTLWCH